MANKGWKNKKTPIIVGTENAPTKMESGQVIINKKATKQNLDKLIEINNEGLNAEKSKISTDGTDGGILKGKPHYDSKGNSLGGIPVIVDGGKKIEVEGEEFVVNKEASQKHWKELSKINQSAGNGVPINPSDVGSDDDPQEFRKGGTAKIIFNPNHIPNKWIYSYAKKVKEEYPKVWDMGGNIFGNEAFKNLERVIKRGYWTDNEEWMYIKWQSYVARHHKDFRIAGTVAMLKWVDKTDKGWDYMKALIDKEIAKKYSKKGFKTKMKTGGGVVTYKNKFNKKYGYDENESHDLKEIAKDTDVSLKGLQQIYNKGIGAYKTNPQSVRPNVKSKEQWAMARVYSAVMGGKAARVDAKELKMEYGGGVKDITCNSCNWSWNKNDSEKHDEYVCHKCGTDNKMENAKDFMRWYIDWNKTINKKINISFSLPNIIQPFKESNVVILDLFEKIDQKIDAKQYLNKIIENADKYGVVIYLEPILKYKYFLKNIEKRKKISKDYLISYYQKFGFQLTTNGRFMKRLPKPRTDNKKKYGGELAKEIKAEQEHIDTAKKLYNQKITPNEAAKNIAKEHLKENAKYYSKMETIDFDKHYNEIKTKYAEGGNLEPTYTLNTPSKDKSRLTYLQQILVRTSTFKNFFGDWETAAKNYLADNKKNYKQHFKNVSKAMDMSILEPRVVYHGTRTEKEFFMFDVSKEKGLGRPYAYFAHNIEYSKNFTDFSQRGHSNSQAVLYECFLNVRNPFMALGQSYETKRKDYIYWLTTIIGTIALDKYDTIEKNTKTKNLESAVKSQIEKYLKDSATDTSVPFWYYMARDTTSEFKYFLLAYGYDGIFYGEEYATNYNVENPKEYTNAVCIFTANDIKLADGRNLNFDPMETDIRYEDGGSIEKPEKTMSKKDRLGSILFGEKYANGGFIEDTIEHKLVEKPMNDAQTFVEKLNKKMKE